MSQRTVAEINQHILTLPPVQTRAFSIQIELPVSRPSDWNSLNNSSQSDNLDPLEVGVKRERQPESPTSPSGSVSIGSEIRVC